MAKINYAKLYTLRKDGRYQAKYKDADGKWKSICHRDPEELHRIMTQRSAPQVMTFAAVAEDWEQVHREEIGLKTWLNYAPHVADIVAKHGKTPIEEITALDVINDLKVAQARGYSATILSTRRSIYRMILDHALINGHVKYNPAVGVKMPKGVERNRREAPEQQMIKTILTRTDAPFALFPILLICSGLRKAEALALTWGDIGPDNITVSKALDYVVHAHPVVKTPKTKAGYRSVPIIATLRPFLVRPEGAKDSDLLFPALPSNRGGEGGGYMTVTQYRGQWQKYCEAVGFVDENGKPTLTAHQLRHGTATLLFEAGVDVITAQTILGHSSPTTTREIYTHLRNTHQSKMVAQFDAMVADLVQ